MTGTLLLLSCSRPADPPAPLRVSQTPAGGGTRLTLVPAPGIRINAQLKPALELPNGNVLRFDSAQLTADSAYFAEPPSVVLSGPPKSIKGTLRASICGEEQACRPFVLEL
jgi:hypothetical protein